ncbi:MAG: DUF3597 domain-containing protein [Burkholderiaceae bacterium]
MGILSSIIQKIFPSSHPAVTQTSAAAPAAAEKASSDTTPQPMQSQPATTAPAAPEALEEVDVEQILDGMPSAQQYKWRTSIVDLMKLLGLDSSLQARTALSHELGYAGSTSDSASMNIWLHRQVMNKLAENGGKVPPDLKD